MSNFRLPHLAEIDGYQLDASSGASTNQVLAYNGTSFVPTSVSSIGVSSVSNSDSSLTISPTTGAVVASLNAGHANSWTATQTFFNIASSVDNTYNIGASGNRFATVFTEAVNSGNSALTFTAGSASVWSTTSGALSVDGYSGINFKNNGTTYADLGVTTSSVFTHTLTGVGTSTALSQRSLEVLNNTAAANNAQQFSPFIALTGDGYSTTNGNGRLVSWLLQTQPVQGAANPTGELHIMESVNGATPTDYFKVTDGTNIQSQQSGASFTLTSSNAAASGRPHIVLNSTNASASTTHHLSLQENGSEKLYTYTNGTTYVIQGTTSTLDIFTSGTTGFLIQNGSTLFEFGGVNAYTMTNGQFYPSTDNTGQFGLNTLRHKSLQIATGGINVNTSKSAINSTLNFNPWRGIDVTGGGIGVSRIFQYTNATVTPSPASGSNTFTYYLLMNDGFGGQQVMTTSTTVANFTTTDATHTNAIALPQGPGVASIDIYRAVVPGGSTNGIGFIGNAQTPLSTFTDSGQVTITGSNGTTSATSTQADTTGNLVVEGSILAGSVTGAGTLNLTNANQTVTGSSTAFTSGDVGRVITTYGGRILNITAVASPTSITVYPAPDQTVNGVAYTITINPTTTSFGVANGNVVFGDTSIGGGAGNNSLVGIGITPTYGLHQLANGSRLQAAGDPTSVSVTQTGAAGTTRVDYLVIAKDKSGNKTVGTYVSTILANSTLNSTNYNVVNWTRAAGTVSVDIYRFNSGASGNGGTTGSISLANTGTSFNDQGAAASAYTLPTRNKTADDYMDGFAGSNSTSPTAAIYSLGSGSTLVNLGTPSAPTITMTGTDNGQTNTYYIVAYDAAGNTTLASATTSNTHGPTAFSTSNYATITWSAVTGAVYYDVICSVSGSTRSSGTTGSIGLKIPGTSYVDSGQAATAYTTPAADYTAQHTSQVLGIASNQASPGVLLQNSTASTSGTTQQIAPGIQFESHAWKSNATAADQKNLGFIGYRGITGAAATTSEFFISTASAGAGSGSFTEQFKITDATLIQSQPNATFTLKSNVTMGGTSTAFIIQPTNSMSSGDKVLSVQTSASTEIFRVGTGAQGAFCQITGGGGSGGNIGQLVLKTTATNDLVGIALDATQTAGAKKWTMYSNAGGTFNGYLLFYDGTNNYQWLRAGQGGGISDTNFTAINLMASGWDVNRNSIGAGQTVGMALFNDSASSAGTPVQRSGLFALGGRVWNTSGTPANNFANMALQLIPTSSGSPTNQIDITTSVSTTNTPSWTTAYSIFDNGTIESTTNNTLKLQSDITMSGSAVANVITAKNALTSGDVLLSVSHNNNANALMQILNDGGHAAMHLIGDGNNGMGPLYLCASGAGASNFGINFVMDGTHGSTAVTNGRNWEIAQNAAVNSGGRVTGSLEVIDQTGGGVRMVLRKGATGGGIIADATNLNTSSIVDPGAVWSMMNTNIGTAQTLGASLFNSTATSGGATGAQYSGALSFVSHGWNTTAVAADNYSMIMMQGQTTSNVTSPAPELDFYKYVGASSTPTWTKIMTLSSAGTHSFYNGETTAGVGHAYIEAVAQDVVSGGSSTNIVTYSSPVSGLYRVTIVVSAHTNNDTVAATCTYTDAVESFATTLSVIPSTALTHDSNTGTISGSVLIRASAATNIVAILSTTSQTTTKASAIIERVN